MTVRFKCRSEYQKSYRVSRSRSASSQRCVPLAGLRSDQMGISREPCFQRRRRFSPRGLAQSCSSQLRPPDPQPPAHRVAPPVASRSRSAHRKDSSLEANPPTPPGARADPGPPAGPVPAAEPGPSVEPGDAGKSEKPRPSEPDSQPQLSRPLTAEPDGPKPSANEVQHALRWRAGLRAGGQRSGSQRSEYHRQFSWKKPATAASPILTAEQVLHASSRSVPPFKKHPVPMETEYRRSFQGLVPPPEPLEHHQRVPLFHTHTNNKKRREESEGKPRPKQDVPSNQKEDATPPPPQVQRGHRVPEGGGATDDGARQAKALRQQALSYRHRAWGANFSRDHLSQLLSQHNALWEPTDTTDSDTTTPCLTFDLCPDTDSRSSSSVEALDLAREEGRLPTPRLKIRPVQRTHHDLTTPATGGAILVGKLKSDDESSPHKPRCGSAVSMAAGAETATDTPVRLKEAWHDNNPAHVTSSGPSPDHKPATGPSSKPIRTKHTSRHPVTPPPLVPPPQHCIQGTLRNADFQHNGELGLRFRELQCAARGSDEDDRLSVMSWRSAASCSVASAVLERAQKRRESFWGKR
ncbi:nuclear protein MDM1 isoform X2 [Cottoperca gobio]|uniref:Nuclear protein MDM1 n=1 Tax=Cottoperca gobio TaxID=56716 RepID=A0A6J2PF40_COTGO|nr:nuclear protein MDM1 isoform X2 [Cottoperca gobio]